MPVEKDVDERVWCPGFWPWQWFDTCIERNHKWCYNFSWLKKTGYALVIHHEGCEAGTLYTWNEFGLGIADLGTEVPGEMCFDSPRSSEGVCDASNTGLAASPLTPDKTQADWRYCRKCHELFFDGYANKGVCPARSLKMMVVVTAADLPNQGNDLIIAALVGGQLHVRIFDAEGNRVVDKAEHELVRGDTLSELKKQLTNVGDHARVLEEREDQIISDAATIAGYQRVSAVRGHVAQGYNFALPHDVAESAWAQKDWRYCHKCHAMFYDGYPNKGVCPAGGGHAPSGFVFVLPHDVADSESAQKDWRYCHKCHTMFFDGYANKGVCAAGGGHVASGFNFVLSHP